MKSLSTSFVLGKASTGNANIEHNNREIIASNVDPSRICDNVTYVRQNVEETYAELFSEAVTEYNLKQKQPCRRIHNYFNHICVGKREEPYYEVVVQFGSMKEAAVGSPNGELAKKMLDEYARGFQARNPNLRVFNLCQHLDEASPHLHINFVPFYTQGRQKGLSKGVSMKAALDEQGFTAKSAKQNRLVAWQDSERKIMEGILQHHGLEREVKNDKSVHRSVPDYKEAQDAKKLLAAFERGAFVGEITMENVERLEFENALLQTEKQKLIAEKSSPWKSFFYSDSDKQSFVLAQLATLNIPHRETGNGFEAQEIYVDEIRKIEKSYKPKENPHRETLRDLLDKSIMQSQSYDEVLERLRESGCEVKCGKYVAVKPKYATNFIRLKSLGEDYSEQAIKNRLEYKRRFESDIDNKIQSADKDTPYYMVQKTVRHYTVVFAAGVLPMKRLRKKKPFSWENCEELNKLASLNRKINEGVTLGSLRNDFVRLEKSVADKDSKIAELKSELDFYRDLYSKAERCFKFYGEDESDLAFLAEHKVTAENYARIPQLFTANENEIAELEESMSLSRQELRDTVDTLDTLEKVIGGTYVQSLVDEEKQRAQSVYIRNGLKYADGEESKIENATARGTRPPKR